MVAVREETLGQRLEAGPDERTLVEELGLLTLQGIKRKVPQLEAAKEGTRKQLHELASASCTVFVESADSVRAVHTELARVCQHVDELEGRVPVTQLAPQAAIEERRLNAALLARHGEILEMLEQPTLMDTCVRNGFVEEALELEAAARSRALLHPDVPLLAQLADDVSAHVAELRTSLIGQLARPLSLRPACSPRASYFATPRVQH